MRAVALRYALAPACVLLAVLVHLSPAGSLFPYGGLFVLAVVGAAWFGGAGPGFLTAALSAFALPQLVAASHSVLGGFLDLPRFIVFSVIGIAVGWGSSRAAGKLREQERYARAMEASDDGFWDWTPATDTVYASPRLLEIYGLAPDTTFNGRDDLVRSIPFHPEDRLQLARAIAEHFAGKRARLDIQVRFTRDAETRWVHLAAVAVRDSSGAVVRWIGTVRDITEHKRVEEALRASEERYGLAMEASEDGNIDCDVQTDRFITSERMREIFEVRPGTRIAYRSDFNEQFRFYSDEDAKVYGDAMRTVSAQGGPDRYEFEFRVVLPSGKVKWIWTRSKVTRDAEGRALRRVGVVADVTSRKLAEQALRTSEERFALAVAGSQGSIWDVDFVTRTVFFSARTRELCGLPPGPEVAPLDEWIEALPIHPEDSPRRNAALAAHLSGQAPAYEGEFRLRQADGVYRWRHVRGVCVRDADGKPLRMAGSINDVDARRRAEEALRESEDRFARAVTGSSDGVWDIDLVARSVYFSPRTRELCGLPPGPEVVPLDGWFEALPLHPEDLPQRFAAVSAHLSGKAPAYDGEFRFLQPDGVYRWRHLHGVCVRDADGKPVRMAGSMSDVDARRRAEEALRESEQRYELAMAASESGYWDWQIPTDQYHTSPRAFELAGYPPGTRWVTRDEYRANINMHPEDFARWEAAREELFAGTGERLAMEVRYIVGGETRWHSLQGICRRDDTGKVIRWTGSTTDVTPRRRAEEELRAMEVKLRQAQRLEAMGTFAGGIAHDFNNILGAVLGYGELALRAAPKGSRIAGDLENIVTAGERGRALVGRLLSFSRSVVGERVPVHVERVVREALELVSAKLPPGLTVDAGLHAGRAAILGDETQVHQVVANLATNAIQAMSAGGALRVELANLRVGAPRAATIGGLAVGDFVVLTVADTGPGIPPEIMERIFDPFFTTKEHGTGTGLGLSLVHGIVTELGGCIDLTTKVGAGTTFTVYLPRSGEVAEAEDDAQLALPRGDGQRVLVLDDEEPLVTLATRTLEELGYAPVGFTSSGDALAALRADPERFDALITDERMPGVSGSALIREVRGIRSSMPVLLMSGYLGPTADKVRQSGQFHTLGLAQKIAAAIGADEVLQKPASARDLATSLARVLRL